MGGDRERQIKVQEVIMQQERIPLYVNEAEKKQHGNAIRLLCEELSLPEEFMRPLYEEILYEMKKQARIRDYLSILVCRTIRDLARGYEGSSFLRLDEWHVKTYSRNVRRVMQGGTPQQGAQPALR